MLFWRVYSQGCVYSACVTVFWGLEADRIVCPCEERRGAQVCSQSGGGGVRITLWNTKEINYKKYIGSWTQDPRPRKRTKALIQRFIPCSLCSDSHFKSLHFTSKHHIFCVHLDRNPRKGVGHRRSRGLIKPL